MSIDNKGRAFASRFVNAEFDPRSDYVSKDMRVVGRSDRWWNRLLAAIKYQLGMNYNPAKLIARIRDVFQGEAATSLNTRNLQTALRKVTDLQGRVDQFVNKKAAGKAKADLQAAREHITTQLLHSAMNDLGFVTEYVEAAIACRDGKQPTRQNRCCFTSVNQFDPSFVHTSVKTLSQALTHPAVLDAMSAQKKETVTQRLEALEKLLDAWSFPMDPLPIAEELQFPLAEAQQFADSLACQMMDDQTRVPDHLLPRAQALIGAFSNWVPFVEFSSGDDLQGMIASLKSIQGTLGNAQNLPQGLLSMLQTTLQQLELAQVSRDLEEMERDLAQVDINLAAPVSANPCVVAPLAAGRGPDATTTTPLLKKRKTPAPPPPTAQQVQRVLSALTFNTHDYTSDLMHSYQKRSWKGRLAAVRRDFDLQRFADTVCRSANMAVETRSPTQAQLDTLRHNLYLLHRHLTLEDQSIPPALDASIATVNIAYLTSLQLQLTTSTFTPSLDPSTQQPTLATRAQDVRALEALNLTLPTLRGQFQEVEKSDFFDKAQRTQAATHAATVLARMTQYTEERTALTAAITEAKNDAVREAEAVAREAEARMNRTAGSYMVFLARTIYEADAPNYSRYSPQTTDSYNGAHGIPFRLAAFYKKYEKELQQWYKENAPVETLRDKMNGNYHPPKWFDAQFLGYMLELAQRDGDLRFQDYLIKFVQVR